MTVSALTSSAPTSTSTSSTSAESMSAFRTADFLKIMMAEITQQDPLQPQDTGKLVENMQKLQDLANTQFTKFRGDVKWAQDLMGKSVTVKQQGITEKAATDLKNRGLSPDVGYGNVTGAITSFKVVDQTVYVHIGEHDYPTDNVQQVTPQEKDPATLSQVANELMGRQVTYRLDDSTAPASGPVTGVGWGTDGQLALQINGQTQVPYAAITAIGIPAGANGR